MSAHVWRIILYRDREYMLLRCVRCGSTSQAPLALPSCDASATVYVPEERD